MTTTMTRRTRRFLAAAWALFLAAWFPATWFVLVIVGLGPCGGDGGTPYYDPASQQGDYCEGVSDFFGWGEPGALHALPFFVPTVLPIAIGVVGVWRQSARLLVGAASVLSVASLLHLTLAFALPG
jgi:hypothetical protein